MSWKRRPDGSYAIVILGPVGSLTPVLTRWGFSESILRRGSGLGFGRDGAMMLRRPEQTSIVAPATCQGLVHDLRPLVEVHELKEAE